MPMREGEARCLALDEAMGARGQRLKKGNQVVGCRRGDRREKEGGGCPAKAKLLVDNDGQAGLPVGKGMVGT